MHQRCKLCLKKVKFIKTSNAELVSSVSDKFNFKFFFDNNLHKCIYLNVYLAIKN